MTIGQFREAVLALVQRRFPDRSFERGVSEADLAMGSIWISLRNLFDMTRLRPDGERQAEILRFFEVIARDLPASLLEEEALDDWATAESLLRPKLLRRDALPNVDDLVLRPFAAKLVLAYGLDLGQRDAYVFHARFAKWNVTSATVHEAAIINLERTSVDVDLNVTRTGEREGLAIVNKGDFYDASRILLSSLRVRLAAELGPKMLAGIPDRTALFVWSAGLAGQDGLIGQIRSDAAEQSYALTDEIFVLSGDGPRLAAADDLRRP